ncbi:DUF4179 domain-containing protein [Bacillus sp. CGMCC 1.16607]|uniref:DUF4179 domain-containing protein n=1 Tax=Bacillus sp. CGMCC 1.16607 TaxID=3351842 RepID=UPI0036348196
MKCWETDKLSQYVDELVSEQEQLEINGHLINCEECKAIVAAFKEEQRFLIETLQTPTLPDHFASLVIEQLEPYEQKVSRSKKFRWKRVLLPAAGFVLAVGLSASLSPAFAQWIGGLFGTDRVDEGLQIANEAGFTQSVNREVTDNGITFKIEDMVADPSRVAFSFQILDENGKSQNPMFEMRDGTSEIVVTDKLGKKLELGSMGWSSSGGKIGLFEFPLNEHPNIEEMIVKFHFTELDKKKGNWQLEVPVDLRESLKATTKKPINAVASEHGMNINLKEVRFAPSASEIIYETSFTKEEEARLSEKIQMLEKKFGKKHFLTYTNFGTNIQYHIENKDGKALYQHNTFTEDRGHTTDSGAIQGSGRNLGPLGHMAWNDSFIPQKSQEELTFVLDGVVKTVPSDFEVTFKPKELKDHPVSFEYEGNYMTIKEAEKQTKWGLRKALFPIEKETSFVIEMEGGKEVPSSEFGIWILVDKKGKSYSTYHSGSVLDEKDKNGRYITTQTIASNDIDEVPEELTLHLLSVTRYYEVKDKWKVLLH